jgi:hypothetical protein
MMWLSCTPLEVSKLVGLATRLYWQLAYNIRYHARARDARAA